MTGRTAGTLVLLTTLCLTAGCQRRNPPADPQLRAGDPLPGLTDAQTAQFLLGRGLFERRASPEEGLGPLFNAERCSACHDQPAVGGGGTLRVLKATRFVEGQCDLLAESGGDNIQQRATPALAAHGIQNEEVPANATATALVTSPPLFGLGLIAAVPEETLLALADPEDLDRDGISGKVGRASDGRISRFGRKAEIASIRDFVDTALRFELGLTTPEHPVEELVNGASLPSGVDPMPDPEIDARGIDLLAAYVQFLAAPTRAAIAPGAVADSVEVGEQVFRSLGCASCHVPSLVLGPDAPAGVDEIQLYSDLLLHDMGDSAADVCAGIAAPSEYRTPALWGLRFRRELLHDGLAPSVGAALARHGGEALAAQMRFASLSAGDRASLLRFLGTL